MKASFKYDAFFVNKYLIFNLINKYDFVPKYRGFLSFGYLFMNYL